MGVRGENAIMTEKRSVHPNERIVECKVSGPVDIRRLAEIGKECRLFAFSHNFSFLLDVSETSGLPSQDDAVEFFRRYYSGIEHELKLVHTAIVVCPEYYETFQVVAEDWNSQGADVGAFMDRDEAFTWLIETAK